MNAHERNWEALTSLWHAENAALAPDPLQALLAAHRRRLAAVVAGECVLLLAFVGLSWLAVRDGLAVWELVWLSTLWSFAAIAVPFTWWNRRGSWNEVTESVAEFQRRRARRARRTVRFSCALFAAEVAVVSAELAWFDRLTPTAMFILAELTVVFLGWVFWMHNFRTRRMARGRRDRRST